jgi:hypothetical protein
MFRHLVRVTILFLLPIMTGCNEALTVPNTFPEPLVEPLPLDVALYYSDEFANYRHRENVAGDSKWDIDIGKANVALFESASRRLFRSATRVSARPTGTAAAGFNAIIEPSVAAFEFSLPSQSATEQYSVWIRYTVKVFSPGGELLTSWNISAYGESESTLLRPARSMEQATILALRDAAATLAVGFVSEARAHGVLPMEKVDVPAP